jgi:CMP-N-acetylneuraminic acid synthetase
MEEDLKAAFEKVIQSGVNFVYPVTEYLHPIQRALRVSKDMKISLRESSHELTRTQDLEKFFHDAGQFYWGTGDAWRRVDLMHSNGHAYIIPYHRVVDIDTNDDWKRAEDLYKVINHKA